jgi:hypothetical protein
MIRVCPPAVRRFAMALLAVSAGTACNDNQAPSVPSDAPALTDSIASGDSVATSDSLATFASVSYSGSPYGPIGLWASPTTFEWGPAPFTLSQDNTYANYIVTRINTARQRGQRLILAMTGGPASDFKTDGKFDLSKWKKRMNTFKTSAIRNAVAAGVSDGTIVGNTMIDEPETPKWGGNVTKAMIDDMAVYVKSIFPSLPTGINQGGPGYKWRTSERFHKLDYVLYQYQWTASDGDIDAWRNAVLDRARIDGVMPALSVNLLNGGRPDYIGTWDCTGSGQAGKGTISRRCRMTADQLKDWGRAIGGSGCFTLMWRYDDAYMSKSANQDAFRSVASYVATKARRSCRRP